MSVVAGVDFGTLSVRVSIVDSNCGRIGSGVAEYPLHRSKTILITQRRAIPIIWERWPKPPGALANAG